MYGRKCQGWDAVSSAESELSRKEVWVWDTLIDSCNQLESLLHKLLANIRQYARQVIEAEHHISHFTVALLDSFSDEDDNKAYGVLT